MADQHKRPGQNGRYNEKRENVRGEKAAYGERRTREGRHAGGSANVRDARSAADRRGYADRPFSSGRSFDAERSPREGRPFNENRPAQGGRAFSTGRPAGGDRPFRSAGQEKHDASFRNERPARGDGRNGGERQARGERRDRAMAAKPAITARDAALRALGDVVARGAYASQAIDRQLTENTISPEDRRLATGIFYAAVENRLRIEHVLAPFIKNSPAPIVRDILHIACAQLLYLDRVPDHAVVDEAVKQTRRMKGQQVTGFVNVVLRNVIRARDDGTLAEPDADDPVKYMSAKYSVSEDLAGTLIDAYGAEEAERICAFRPKEHTQTVRANFMTTSDAELGGYLAENGVEYRQGSVPGALTCLRPGALAGLEGYRKGMYSLQGESSMLAAYAMQARPGMNVLDACAAPGGKSAMLCEMMEGTGRVYAWDVHEHRVELIRAAGRRLRLYNLRPAVRDARQEYGQFEGLMNAVLVDAPCSGLGVIADKPDIRIRFNRKELDELVPLQRDILANCARFVKVGGLLVYSTCTILPEENEKQVREFLNSNPQFAPDTDDSWLPEKYRPLMKDGMLQLMQHRDGTEGFFIARMRRKCI